MIKRFIMLFMAFSITLHCGFADVFCFSGSQMVSNVHTVTAPSPFLIADVTVEGGASIVEKNISGATVTYKVLFNSPGEATSIVTFKAPASFPEGTLPQDEIPPDEVIHEFTVVEVESISGSAHNMTVTSETDTPGDDETLVVCVFDEVTFSSTFNPTGTIPSGQAQWTAEGAGVSQDSGVGETFTVKFNEPSVDDNDFKLITAKCGSGDTPKTIRVGVVKGRVELSFSTFIPHDNIFFPGVDLLFVFSGDNRGFDKNSSSFRTRQSAILAPLKFCDPDNTGVIAGTISREVGVTKLYHAPTSLDVNGNLTDEAKADTITGDLDKLVAADTASTSGMTIFVQRLNDFKIKATLTGSASNPLIPGSPAIDWSLELEIDNTDLFSPTYTLTGSHDGFPAYELYLNDAIGLQYDPIEEGEGPDALAGSLDKSVNNSGTY